MAIQHFVVIGTFDNIIYSCLVNKKSSHIPLS